MNVPLRSLLTLQPKIGNPWFKDNIMEMHTDKGLSRFDPAEYLNSWSARWAYLDEAILSYEPRRGIFPNLAEQRNDFGAIWTVVRSLWASKPDAKP